MHLKNILKAWAYKHPAPDDFFRTMDSEAGEDLSWFWSEWFQNNWQLILPYNLFHTKIMIIKTAQI